MSRRLSYKQIEHLQKRADQAFRTIRNAEIKALGPRPKRPELSDSEKLDLIRNGKAKLDKDMLHRNCYAHLVDFFTYPMTAEQRRQENKFKAWDAKYDAIDRRINEERERFNDQVILGDSAEALEMLKGLELRVKNAA